VVLLLHQVVDGFGPGYTRLWALYLPDLAGAHALPGDIALTGDIVRHCCGGGVASRVAGGSRLLSRRERHRPAPPAARPA